MAYDEPLYRTGNNYGPVANWTDPGAVRGNATTSGSRLNTTGGYVEAHAKYDQLGNVVVSWGPKGNQMQTAYSDAYGYDGLNRAAGARPSSTS